MLDWIFKSKLVGPPEYPRFVIRDARWKGLERFWTGRGWTRNMRKAMLFANPATMAAAVHRLTRRHFARMYSERRFCLKVTVSVYGPGNVTQDQIQDFLAKALKVEIDYQTHGGGPTSDSMILVHVPWTELHPVERDQT